MDHLEYFVTISRKGSSRMDLEKRFAAYRRKYANYYHPPCETFSGLLKLEDYGNNQYQDKKHPINVISIGKDELKFSVEIAEDFSKLRLVRRLKATLEEKIRQLQRMCPNVDVSMHREVHRTQSLFTK